MTDKIFVSDNSIVTLTCPECHKSTDADISRYKDLDKLVKLKISCSCGKPYAVVLERRRTFRKDVDLPGKYLYRPQGGMSQKGLMTVVDISRVGMRMKFRQLPKIQAGAEIEVEFALDDKQCSVIRKQVIVRGINAPFIHGEFCSFDAYESGDKALGFYLL